MTVEEKDNLNLTAKDFELNVPKTPKILDKDIDIRKFRNINGVKASNDTKFISKKQAAHFANEIMKCYKDPIYFAEKYFYIQNWKGKVVIKLYDKQKDMLNSFVNNAYTIVVSARQAGKCVVGNTKIVCKKSDGKLFETTIDSLVKF